MVRRGRSPIMDLLVVFVAVFAFQVLAATVNMLAGLFVLSPPLTENPWTIVTSVYAHVGISHLVSNAIALVLFGWPVARATTNLRFHAFFLTTGALAGISQILVSDAIASLPVVTGSGTPGVLGASGAVFALLGYLLASNRLTVGVSSFVSLPRWLEYLLIVGLAVALTIATAQPGVALIAHFTGLVLGMIAGRVNVLATSRR